MDIQLTDEQTNFRATLRSFFQRVAPTEVVTEWDKAERFPAEVYAKMAELGLCGMAVSEEYGGSDADEISLCILGEEIARASASLVYAFIPTVTFCARGIQSFGTETQKQFFLPKIVSGEVRIAMALSEPGAGSDLTHLSTSARLDGDEWVVNGQKVFSTGADTAQYLFVVVRTEEGEQKSTDLSVLLIPRDSAGIDIRPLPKLSGQATHTCEIFLSDVRVAKDAILGKVGGGVPIVFSLLDGERIVVGAHGLGVAEGAFDLAVKYADERAQFGHPIADFQAVGHMLADMAMDIETARGVIYHAAWRKQEGLPHSYDASVAKVVGSEVGTRSALRGMQVLGGYSYMVEYGMERYYREAKIYEIAGGTNQIQRNIILKHLRAGGLKNW